MSPNKPIQTNTKHIILDNLLPDELCTEIYDSFPKGSDSKYFHVTSFTGRTEENFKRVYGSVDNYFRNKISIILKLGRGKKLINHKK